MLRHYVEYLYPGVIVSETSVSEIPERDVSKVKLPDNSFGFHFFDRTVTVVDDETLTGDKKNISGWYYQGKKMTLEQIKATNDDGEYDRVISNMEINGYAAVVITKFGQFIPLNANDTVM